MIDADLQDYIDDHVGVILAVLRSIDSRLATIERVANIEAIYQRVDRQVAQMKEEIKAEIGDELA